MKCELKTPLFRKGNLVAFDFDNGKQKIPCKGIVVGTDIYRVNGKIQQIEYDIYGDDYISQTKKCLYKHVVETDVKEAISKINDN